MDTEKLQARVTVVCNVYHSVPGSKTVGPDVLRFARYTDNNDEAYARTVTLNETWSSIDAGWLTGKGCSLLVLENSTSRLPGNKPTDAEIDALMGQIVEFGVKSAGGEAVKIGSLSPEEGLAIPSPDIENIVVRSVKAAKLSYFLVSK